MRIVDFNASLSNLTQMDRHQLEAHRAPVVNQVINAAAANEEAAKRIYMPVEPDPVEGEKVDAESHRREKRNAGKRRQAGSDAGKGRKGSRRDTGSFVDIDA